MNDIAELKDEIKWLKKQLDATQRGIDNVVVIPAKPPEEKKPLSCKANTHQIKEFIIEKVLELFDTAELQDKIKLLQLLGELRK